MKRRYSTRTLIVDESRTNLEAAAGALLVLGGMLCEWGLPLEKAIKGLRGAYRIEREKQAQQSGDGER